MGCWNQTCAITNLPIYAGEEVEVIMLQFSNMIAGSSLCYPYFYHVPIPLTFQGIYNDYGAVEDCKGAALNIIIDNIREHLFEMEEGENKYHDVAVKKDEFDVTKMFELDHEDRLNIVNPYRGYPDEKEKTMIKHAVIRKEVYDKLVEGIKVEMWDSEAKETIHVGIDDILKQRHAITEDIDRIIAAPDDALIKQGWIMRNSMGGNSLAGKMLQRHGEYRGVNHPINAMEELIEIREDGTADDYEAVLDNLLRFSMVMYYMNIARKVWVLPSGLGSQDDNTQAQRLCAELTLASAEIVDHKWDEE